MYFSKLQQEGEKALDQFVLKPQNYWNVCVIFINNRSFSPTIIWYTWVSKVDQ